MPSLSDFGRLIQDINSNLESGLIRNANEANRAIANISEAMQGLSLPDEARRKAEELIQLLTVLRDALKRVGEEGEKSSEKMRRGLESVVGQNKQLIELIKVAIGNNQLLGDVVDDVARSFGTLRREGDIGRMIQQFTASIPVFKWFGFFVGEAVSAITKFQDRIQLVNRAVIQAQASLGRFGEGMQQATMLTADLSVGIAEYAQLTGASTDEIKRWVTQLGQAGFALEDMGIDEQTGQITSLNEALGDSSAGFGTLSSTLGLARFAGLEFTQVADQMRMQIKVLGDDTEDVIDTFIGLSAAADRSKLSTSILLPLLRSMQEQFKFVGLDSERAATAISSAAAAADRAEFGPEVGAQVLQRAVSGILGAPFGIQAFLGQQLGLGGGGLAAGFALRQDVGQEPLDIAMGVAQAARRFFGGRAVSPEEARTNQELAAIRLGQEQFIMQLMGLSQLEAKSYLDIVSQLEEMERQGDLDSRARQEAEDRLKALSMTEKDWRAKTLTLQEKMARFLELIWTVVGRVFIGFIRGAAGAAAGPETSNFLAAISRGEGIDVPLEQWSKGITALGREVTPAAERLGGVFGDVFRKLTDWLTGANEHTRSVENRTAAENKATLATLKAADALRQMAGAAGPREKGPAEMLARYIELQDLIERQTTAQQEAFQSLKNIQERQRAAVTPAGSGGIPYTGFTEQAQEEATNRLRETNNALDALKQEMTGLRDQLQEGLPRLPQGDIRSQVEATLGRAQQGGDIWDIMKAGFLYASPGDMVIDAESLGAAAGQGVAGTGISGMLSRLQTQTRGAAATRGGRTSTEHELIFHIKGVDERMNILIDERIAYNIEQDKIVPGKLGASALRHGSSYRGYS